MTAIPDPDSTFAASAARDIAQLEALVAAMQARLAGLHRDVAEAESRLGSMHSVQIVEANEQLVLAAMRAQTEADTASQALEDLSRAARLDALTGLPNREVLFDRLAHAIPNTRRRQAQLALLFLDLNNFKQVNDTLGHAVGDRVLKQVADRLSGSVREGDTVSRLGGDEFVFLLTEVIHATDAAHVAEKLIATLAAPFRVDDHVLRLTASIGISLYPHDGQDASTLLDRADGAMYRAKRDAVRSVVFHDEGFEAERQPNPPALASMQQPLTRVELALADHERLNAQLRQANEHLLVAALGAQELHDSAMQAHRRQTEFLARVAHELRGPLAPISNAVAAMGPVAPSEGTLPRMQAIIQRQVAQMTRLIGDLVDFTRVGTGKFRISRELVDIVDIIDAAIDLSRPAMDIRLQSLVVEVPSCALQLQADPARLTQVLSNLLDNASKYTPNGGEIRLSVAKVDGALMVTVSDRGIGMTAETLPTVFEPFVQDPRALKFNDTGLGIGLTVVRELVEAHGGKVVASSGGSGLGSEFVVTLPLGERLSESQGPD